MSVADLLEHLRKLSAEERLAVIEAAAESLRRDLIHPQRKKAGRDPVLANAGCLTGTPMSAGEIERELYGS